MIFKSLELVNFGIYHGVHTIELSPEKEKPIILIGGLNGRGKTTLIDAFQLALYGKFAKCSSRKRLPYDQFLVECINNKVDPIDGARLTIVIELRHQQALNIYRVSRIWNAQNQRVNETVEVYVDGLLDPMLSDSWDQFIQQLVPLEISEFVFFDGEKIEQLAEPAENRELVKVGIKSLLGINLVSSLISDLEYLPQQRRKKNKGGSKTTAPQESKEKLAELEEKETRLILEIEQLEANRKQIAAEKAEASNKQDSAAKQLEQLQKKFLSIGGKLWEERDVIQQTLDSNIQTLKTLKQKQLVLAEGAAPLALISPLIERLLDDAANGIAAKRNAALASFTQGRDREIIELLENDVEANFIKALAEVQERTAPKLNTAIPDYLDEIDLEKLSEFKLQPALDDAQAMKALAKEIELFEGKVEKMERQLYSLPRGEKVQEIGAAITKEEKELDKELVRIELLNEEQAKIQNRIQDAEGKLRDSRQEIAKANSKSDLESMMLNHLPTLISTLERFKEESAKTSVHKIEHRIVECFDQLVGKADLIKKVNIDPKTFAVSLTNTAGEEIPSSRLSAGERQLLAIAFIWGLASNAPSPLPAVIDTPLGRLDSVHREIMLNRYFPNAAAQVLLLSTDEEVDALAYKSIKPYLAREYSLVFDDESSSTAIIKGYKQTLQRKVA
jgi:DNA sulfur modification protein DndD